MIILARARTTQDHGGLLPDPFFFSSATFCYLRYSLGTLATFNLQPWPLGSLIISLFHVPDFLA